jgi:hypothetical protein
MGSLMTDLPRWVDFVIGNAALVAVVWWRSRGNSEDPLWAVSVMLVGMNAFIWYTTRNKGKKVEEDKL